MFRWLLTWWNNKEDDELDKTIRAIPKHRLARIINQIKFENGI